MPRNLSLQARGMHASKAPSPGLSASGAAPFFFPPVPFTLQVDQSIPLIALFSLTKQVDQTGATLNVSLFSIGGITWTNVSIPAPSSTPASSPAPPPALAPTESSPTGSISRRMLLQAGPRPPGAPPGVGGPPGSGPQPPRPAAGGPPGNSTQPPRPAAGGPPGSTQPPQPAAGGPPGNGAQPPRPAGSSSCVGAAITRCATRVLPPIGETGCLPS